MIPKPTRHDRTLSQEETSVPQQSDPTDSLWHPSGSRRCKWVGIHLDVEDWHLERFSLEENANDSNSPCVDGMKTTFGE